MPILKAVHDRCYMQLALDLWSIYHRKLYTTAGYETFDHYTRALGFSKDRASRLRRIFSTLILKHGLRPKDLQGVDYANALILMPQLNRAPSEKEEWVQKARTLSWRELKDEIDDWKLRNEGPPPAPPSPVHPPSPVTTLPAATRTTVPEKTAGGHKGDLTARKFFLAPDAEELLDEALAEAQRVTKSASDSFNLACVVQHFLAHRLTMAGRDDGRLPFFTRHFEEIYGGRLIHIKDERAWGVLAQVIEDNPDLFGTSERNEP